MPLSLLIASYFVSKTAQSGVHREPHYLLKKGFAVSFLYGICTVNWNKP